MSLPLRILLVINAVATLAAASALALVPGFIPGTVGIELPGNARFLTDLLAGAELALAILAFLALGAKSKEAVRLAVWVLIVLHASSALFGLLAFAQGMGPVVGVNVAVRVAMVALLAWFGLLRERQPVD